MLTAYTVQFVSLWCRQIPELLNCIIRYSTPTEKNSRVPTLDKIQESCEHSSGIVQEQLEIISVIQEALNNALFKLKSIEDRRQKIQEILTALNKITIENEKAAPNKKIHIDDEIEKGLLQQLIQLQQSETNLKSIISSLNQQFDNLNKTIPKYVSQWSEHRDQCFAQLIKQLEAEGITLNDGEKAELRNDNAKAIKAKREELQKNAK